TNRSLAGLPRLYEKYAGHDNNRDFYMANLAETRNMNRVMYREWFPQVMYNHHQTGPAGTVMFAPPFRDPFNHNIDPLVITTLDMVGENLHRRMVEEGKPGTTMRSGSPYSTWWNGGLRTTAYFHNMVGILTETIGSPTPFQIPVVASRLVPTGATPFPIEPRLWKFRESIEYSWTANMSILDLASRYREQFLFNFWKMGHNAIEKARRDTWTNTPARVDELAKKANGQELLKALKAPELRDAKAYVLPSDQPMFATAVKFANTLIKNGVDVYRSSAAFKVGNNDFPAGSLVIPCAQPFRAHVLDMFQPQDHPNDFPAPGAPPTQPYDNAGYTLAFQMAVQFDRILDPLPTLPLEKIADVMSPPKGVILAGDQPGFAFAAFDNNSTTAVQRLQKAGFEVQRFSRDDDSALIGSFYVAPGPGIDAQIAKIADETGVSFTKTVKAPAHPLRLKPARVGLWDRYGGSMESGWTRFVLEQFEIPYQVVFPKELDAGNLKGKFDVLIFPDGAIPAGQGRGGGNTPDNIPTEFLHMLGAVTMNTTVPKLKEFLEAGGSVVTIGSSTSFGYHLGLPIENALEGLKNTQYYVPGSILRARVGLLQPSAWGFPDHVDLFFDNSPVFKFKAGAEEAGLKKVAWFDTDKPLRSGWAWGQEKLKDGIAIIEAPVGKGRLYLFGPEILFRAQSHGTFKFLFNAIVNS
ncbi:MAG TPA: hypothetical protein VK934_03775, partial [Fimbriimonas sp.]|nr:hypothetical protein [Fimbriimonas sp.]